MSTLVFDIEVAFEPKITKAAIEFGLDEKKFSWHIDAGMRYVTHISYKIDNQKVVDLSLLDYKGSLEGSANEKQLLEDFSKVYNSCDESVAHYGSKFDIRFLNSRIAKHGLPRLKPLTLRDTWRILKDKFALPNNRLDTAIKFFKCPFGKPSLEWDIWRKVSLGDVKAHKLLRHRCHYDVLSLAWIYYEKLRVHDTGRINRALSYDLHNTDTLEIKAQLANARCPDCAVRGMLSRRGYLYSKATTKVRTYCTGCLSWSSAAIKKDGSIGRVS